VSLPPTGSPCWRPCRCSLCSPLLPILPCSSR
jgi:hypothetical protein